MSSRIETSWRAVSTAVVLAALAACGGRTEPPAVPTTGSVAGTITLADAPEEAELAGTLVTVGYAVSPGIGLEWTLRALVVIVLAGLGSVFGTFLGGILLGVAEAASVLFIGGAYREVVGLVLFVLVLLIRPQGLFGRSR